MKAIVTDKKFVIVGLGKTGLSCVRFLSNLGKNITIMDTRERPPGLDELNARYPHVQIVTGALNKEILLSAGEIIVSPGLSLEMAEIKAAKDAGVLVRGDIDLFAEAAKAPIIGITGSNGKSTVTTMLGDMALKDGLNVGVGGNLGTPALDLLADDKDLYVLELSSFQLETTEKLNAKSVVLLNLSEDHMDRYPSKIKYLEAKQRIFRGAENIIVNDDEILSSPLVNTSMKLFHFGMSSNDLGKFSVAENNEKSFLVHGYDVLMPIDKLKIRGEHNISNALAALALGYSVGLKMTAMIDALSEYSGLDHRCQYIKSVAGVEYVNDSKGTNPGSVITALNSLGKTISGKIILIAGGDSKDADLSGLIKPIKDFVKALVLIGVDAEKFQQLFSPIVMTFKEESMRDAVQKSSEMANAGDLVLLSPACASFDMFKNFEHRGNVFVEEVGAL